jgi:DNA-binding MarR family transcriptional regulator
VDSEIGPATGLVRLMFLLQSVYAEVGKESDLTVPQAQLLCTLKNGPLGMAALCATLGLEKSSLTGLVDRAEQRNLVLRQSSPDDRRAVLVTLTRSGAKAIDRFHTELTERLDGLIAELPAPERERFTKTLARVVADVPAVF